MALDRRRIVTLDQSGTATTVKDIEDATNYYSQRGTFTVTPGAAQPTMAVRQRRFGGATAIAETTDNGTISWTSFVKAATPQAALDNAEALFTVLRSGRRDLWFEWRASTAPASTFYEVRGPATITPKYDAVQFAQTNSLEVEVSIPVGPLALGAPSTQTISSTTTPAVVSLSSAVSGSAPALCDVTIRTGNGTGAAPVWALIGWTQRPSAPLASSVAPFGLIEADSGTLTTFATVVDSGARGGNRATTTASGAGTGSTVVAVDPSTLVADDFAAGDLDVEVWARVYLNSGLVSPRAVLSLQPFAGVAYGGEQFSGEYGSVGKALTIPSSSTTYRFVRLGTVSMPVDKAQPLKWNLKVAMSWASGSSGTVGLDYLMLVPARQRALGPTGKPNDSSYPDFIGSNADTQRRIRGADLSGQVASAAGNFGRGPGLGGSPIELPTGNVDMLLKLSSVVPDDPTSDTTTEQLSHTVTGSLTIWPRFWLGRGA